MNEKQQIDLVKAKRAVERLKKYARRYCINPDFANEVNDAQLISAALSSAIAHDVDMSFDIAANLIEDVNYHDLAAIIRNTF